eukprot:scaffold5166_cov152-Cylindrotheca_fusiformis.AAC.1
MITHIPCFIFILAIQVVFFDVSIFVSSFQRSIANRRPLRRVWRFSSSKDEPQESNDGRPKLIAFDLDGCLWKPEMYELSWYGKGSPFKPDGKGNMISAGGEKVRLLGNVREIFSELYRRQDEVLVGISSRTDEPSWSRELLDKFLLDDGKTSMASVLNGPIEISYDNKRDHFRRISRKTGIAVEDMVFFDNERGNCADVARLGVTVAYVPNGVTKKLYQSALDAFPAPKGKVVNIDV